MNFHGGDVYKYGKAIIDFSSNVNPLGVPDSFVKSLNDRIGDFTLYPDINYIELRNNLAVYLGINDIDCIIPGNGAVEIIYKSIVTSGCKEVLALSPTFSEYSRAVSSIGIPYKEICAFSEDYQMVDINRILSNLRHKSLIIICNPNNPTGTLMPKRELCLLAEELTKSNSTLLIDEAFIEFTEEYPSNSMISEINRYDNLIITRALTKFFGMPGIRLGYGVSGNKNAISYIKEALEPWNVNTAAVIAASSVLKDIEYIKRSGDWLSEERNYLYNKLSQIEGIEVFKSMANFHLIKLLRYDIDAWKLKNLMIEKRILVRTPDGFNNLSAHHIRLAVKDRASNDMLIDALKAILD